MPDENVFELADMLKNRALQTLSFIPALIDLGDYHAALNRSYYAAFYAMKAPEIIDGYDAKNNTITQSFLLMKP